MTVPSDDMTSTILKVSSDPLAIGQAELDVAMDDVDVNDPAMSGPVRVFLLDPLKRRFLGCSVAF